MVLRFNTVEIIELDITLGLHSCGGAPIAISWNVLRSQIVDLEEFERVRHPARRPARELLLSRRQRVTILLRNGVPIEDIVETFSADSKSAIAEKIKREIRHYYYQYRNEYCDAQLQGQQRSVQCQGQQPRLRLRHRSGGGSPPRNDKDKCGRTNKQQEQKVDVVVAVVNSDTNSFDRMFFPRPPEQALILPARGA